MRRGFLTVLAAVVLVALSAEAATYKGQREFHKKCKKCHDNGQEIAATYKKREWKKLFKKKGEGLAELHIKNKDAKDSVKYFESKRYKKYSRHLKDFMVEYAKDSGNVPACN